MLTSVSNALRALEYLVETGEAGVSEIGRQIGVTVGTAHRLVATLVAAGFAEQNPTNRKYRPGQKLLTLANKMRAEESAFQVAHGHLVQLARAVDETVNLAVLREDHVLYVDKVASEQPFGIEARVGSRLPAYCTALGKVLLGDLDKEELSGYIKRVRGGKKNAEWPPPPPAAKIREIVQSARDEGVAEDPGECIPDVFCVAAPIYGSGDRVVAAVSISTPRSRFESQRESLTENVRSTAESISHEFRQLGVADMTA